MKKETNKKKLGKIGSLFITLLFIVPVITCANSEALPVYGTKLAEERLPEILSVLSEVRDNADACEVMTEIATEGYFVYPGYTCDHAMRPIKWKKWLIRSQNAKTLDDVLNLLNTSNNARDPSEGSLVAGIDIGKAGFSAISDGLHAGAAMVKGAVVSTTRKFRSECTTDDCNIASDALLQYISLHSKSTALYILHNPRYRPLASQVVQIIRPVEIIGKFLADLPSNYVRMCQVIGVQPLYLIVLIACVVYLNVDDVEAHILVIVYILTLIYSFTVVRIGKWATKAYNIIRDAVEYINTMNYMQYAMFLVCSVIIGHIRAKMVHRSHYKNILSTMAAIAVMSYTTSISFINSSHVTLAMMAPGITNASGSRRYIQKYIVLAVIVLIIISGTQQSEAKESIWNRERVDSGSGLAFEKVKIEVGDEYPAGLDPQVWMENLIGESLPEASTRNSESRKHTYSHRDKCELLEYFTGWKNFSTCNFSYYIPQIKVMHIETRRARSR